MITYNELANYIQDENGLDTDGIVLTMWLIEDEYGDYLSALEEHGYEEVDSDTYTSAMQELSDEIYVESMLNHNYTCNGEDYLVFDDYDDAKEYAANELEDFIDDMSMDSLRNYVDEDYFETLASDSFTEVAQELVDSPDDEYGNELVRDLYDRGLLDDSDFEEDEEGNILYDDCIHSDWQLVDTFADDAFNGMMSDYGSASEWYIDMYGTDSFYDIVKYNKAIDVEAWVDDVITSDGIGHILASADGEEIEYSEYDGVTYYIYKR